MAIVPARNVRLFAPADNRGKWHAKWLIDGTARCGSTAPLSEASMIATEGDRPHPLGCARCIRLVGSPGYTDQGVVR